MKQMGELIAGNPHDGFDVAGTGNVTMGAGLRAAAKATEITTGPYRWRASPRPYLGYSFNPDHATDGPWR